MPVAATDQFTFSNISMTANDTIRQQFREAMSFCTSGVHIITTDGAAGRYGITMTAVAAVTDEPPTMLLCVNQKTRIHPILQSNRHLCINVLAAHQQDAAEHFAGMTALTPAERFEQHIWHRGSTGQLQIEGALAHLHGHITAEHSIGTHSVFYVQLDEISAPHAQQQPPLVYYRRQFGLSD